MQSADWALEAACRGQDPDLWYPPAGVEAAEAKAICGTCPVRADCLEDALARRERYGVWGGRSEDERRQILQHRHGRQSYMARSVIPAGPTRELLEDLMARGFGLDWLGGELGRRRTRLVPGRYVEVAYARAVADLHDGLAGRRPPGPRGVRPAADRRRQPA